MEEEIFHFSYFFFFHTFFNNNNIIYNLQFVFKQKYPTPYALINLTENIRKALDGGV